MSLIETFALPEVRDFVKKHAGDDWQKLLLSADRWPGLPVREIAVQVQCRRKAAGKLPSWVANPDVIFPGVVPVEQASSERAAAWKAQKMGGRRFADLTGGMGVDFLACHQRFESSVYCERFPEIAELTAWNLRLLAPDPEKFICIPEDGLSWLEKTPGRFDWLYLDPARRDDGNRKVVRLEDCEPDVVTLRDTLLARTNNLMIKASPMLDIDQAVRQLEYVRNVYVVAVDDEVRELLFHLTPGEASPGDGITIETVNLLRSGEQRFSFQKEAESESVIGFSAPLNFLYEPNAAVLKAGAFRSLGAFSPTLRKLAPSSHLYTSDAWLPDFPGRSFSVRGVARADRKDIAGYLPGGKANLTVRNFPMSVADLRKKLKLEEGGEDYLFATTGPDQSKIVVICRKIPLPLP